MFQKVNSGDSVEGKLEKNKFSQPVIVVFEREDKGSDQRKNGNEEYLRNIEWIELRRFEN